MICRQKHSAPRHLRQTCTRKVRENTILTPHLYGKEFVTLTTKRFTRFSRPFRSPMVTRSIFRAYVLWRRRLHDGRCRSVARELLWNGGVHFSAFGQPGSITRFCVIWRNVTSLQLIYVVMGNGNGNGLLFHTTQPTSRSTIKAIAYSKPTISEN